MITWRPPRDLGRYAYAARDKKAMNILLYADDGFDVDVKRLADALNERTSHLTFRAGNATYRSGGETISRPASYEV